MIPQLESAETLKTLAPIVGGMKALHVLFNESGNDIAYSSLSRYISGGVKFESKVFSTLFNTIREGKSFTAREAMRNLEDAYIVLNELVGQGIIIPRKMGEAGEIDKDWEKKQALTKEEIKDMEAEFNVKLSAEQRELLQGKRKSLPKKSSVSVDDLFEEEEEQIVMARNEKAEVIVNPTKEEAEEFLEEQPEPVEEKKKTFLEDFLDEDSSSEPEPVPQSGLTDPFEAELRQTPDVFSSENARI